VTAHLLPVVLTAALMIAGATLTLLVSGVKFLSSFGPGLSISVLIGASVAITLVPAVLAIFGPAILWPRGAAVLSAPEDPVRDSEQARLVGFAAAHPLLITLFCVALLGAAASGIRDLSLGNPVIRGLPTWSDPRAGYEAVSRDLGPGVVGPTMLVVEEPGIAAKRRALDGLELRLLEEPGVSAVIGPTQALGGSPRGVFLAPDGSAARFALILDANPTTGRATSILAGVEQRLPEDLRIVGLGEATAKATGDTSIAAELNSDTKQAFLRVAPAALAVLLVLLWLLLRSRSAPLYLLAVSVLVVAAAIGLTVYVFQGLLGYGELAFFVPVAAAILLLALGSDYNVFLISRIWREAERHDLRPAIRTAGSRAARAITVAGVTLALSFAAVALVPILSFRELAFAMSVGLLLDTLVARTLLIPALVSLFGRGAAGNLEASAASFSSSP
jgi:RND superfamily putative drug exporter